MRKIFFAALFLVSIASTARADEYRDTRQQTYLSEMRQTMQGQDVDPKIMNAMDDYLLSVGKVYCVWKETPGMFASYDRIGLAGLKLQEEQLKDDKNAQILYKFYALVQLTHKSSAEKHLCPGTIPYRKSP